MLVSIELVASGGPWLLPCVISVLEQSSRDWRLSLAWDASDAAARQVVALLDAARHPSVRTLEVGGLRGAAARRWLTAGSSGEWILPLDDDCILARGAVGTLLRAAAARPWCGILRARRRVLTKEGSGAAEDPLPFGPRRYQEGMTLDLENCAKPYLLRRSVYQRTAGWRGEGKSMDADLLARIEEREEIEHIDRCLCVQREADPTSVAIGGEALRALAKRTIRRRALPLVCVDGDPSRGFRRLRRPRPDVGMVQCVVPFWRSDDEEMPYPLHRLGPGLQVQPVSLGAGACFVQRLGGGAVRRIELVCQAKAATRGVLRAALRSRPGVEPPLAEGCCEIHSAKGGGLELVSVELTPPPSDQDFWLELRYAPASGAGPLLAFTAPLEDGPGLLMRLFRHRPGSSRRRLARCLRSLERAGIATADIQVVEARRSSAANRNEGVARTSKAFVCFVDDDVEVTSEDLFPQLLAGFVDPEVGLAGPRILGPDRRIFCAAPYFDERCRPRPRGLGEPDTGQYDYAAVVPWLPSTLLLARRAACLATGGFHEGFPGSQMEDVDFSLRCRARGFTCRYDGKVAVLHATQQRNARAASNLGLLLARWRGSAHLLR